MKDRSQNPNISMNLISSFLMVILFTWILRYANHYSVSRYKIFNQNSNHYIIHFYQVLQLQFHAMVVHHDPYYKL